MDNQVFRYISGSDTPTASRSLRKLCEGGLLQAKGKGSGTYYVPTASLIGDLKVGQGWRVGDPGATVGGGPEVLPEGVSGLSGGVRPLSEGVGGLSEGVPALSGGVAGADDEVDPSYTETWGPMTERLRQLPKHVRGVPPDLLSRVEGLGKRAKPADVRATVLALCAWRPLSADHLARILGRDQRYITEKYLSPMIESKELEYTIPDIPFHMNQAYKIPQKALNEGRRRMADDKQSHDSKGTDEAVIPPVAMAISCIVFSPLRASMATLALNSLSYLLRIVVVDAPFLVLGKVSIHRILPPFRVQILGLIIQGRR